MKAKYKIWKRKQAKALNTISVVDFLRYPLVYKQIFMGDYCPSGYFRRTGWLYNNSRHLARKYALIFVRGHYLFREANIFGEGSSRNTVSYEEQIMSKDKYPNIFSPQMEAIVFIILQIFFATHVIFKIEEYSLIFSSLSWGIFVHVTSLDKLRASEKIWWIIRADSRAEKGRAVKRAVRSWANVWCGEGLARALLPRFRCN